MLTPILLMSNSCGLAQERLELVLAMGTATPTKDKPPSSRNSSRTDRSSQPSTRRYRDAQELAAGRGPVACWGDRICCVQRDVAGMANNFKHPNPTRLKLPLTLPTPRPRSLTILQELRPQRACRRTVLWLRRLPVVTQESFEWHHRFPSPPSERESVRDGNHLEHITATVRRRSGCARVAKSCVASRTFTAVRVRVHEWHECVYDV